MTRTDSQKVLLAALKMAELKERVQHEYAITPQCPGFAKTLAYLADGQPLSSEQLDHLASASECPYCRMALGTAAKIHDITLEQALERIEHDRRPHQ